MKDQPNDKLISESLDAVRNALIESHLTIEKLGSDGIQTVHKNQFGDTALRGDIDAEKAVIRSVKESGLTVSLYSEEHGKTEISGRSNSPHVAGVLDGIDGSSVYIANRLNGLYGTLFAILDGTNPRYDDYLAAGIMQHATGRLILAAKNQGVQVVDVKTGNHLDIPHIRTATSLDESNTVAYVDSTFTEKSHPLHAYFKMNESTFSKPLERLGIEPKWLGASAAYYASLVLGEADIVGEGTRKGNLEIAVVYGLIKEAGGVMQTINGNSIGPELFLKFGQDEHIAVLSASNEQLAGAMRAAISKS